VLRKRWSADFPGAVNVVPTLTESGLWVASATGRLALVDPQSGAVRWSVQTERSVTAGVGALGSFAVVATSDGSLLAYDAQGKRLWRAELGAEAVTVPTVTEQGVYVRCSDRRTLAFDRRTGRRIWSLSRSAPNLVLRQTTGITALDSRLFLGFPGGRLAAVDALGGAQIWETAVAVPRGSNEIERIADVVGWPSVVQQDVCAVAFQGRLACFETATGRMLWSRELSSSMGLAGSASVLAVADEKGHIHAFSRSGASLWRQTALAGRSPSAPVVSGARMLISDVDGLLYAIALDDGAIEARVTTDGRPASGAPIQSGDRVWLQTRGGALHAFAIEPV
jgi:outer membrane protein assembly factor BamB